jgi:hypothetical protein
MNKYIFMIRLFTVFIFSFFSAMLFAQNKSRVSIEANYGINGNFFVASADYGISGGAGEVRFFQKNFIGSIGGVEMKYNLSKKSRLGIAYAKAVNKKEIKYTGNFINLGIADWKITHINNFYQFFYERDFDKQKRNFKYHAGLFYLRMNQQEIEIADRPSGGAGFEERNFKNSNLEEGGLFVGFHYSKKIDTKFELGIKSRIYYLLSTGNLEAITLTPTLTYSF